MVPDRKQATSAKDTENREDFTTKTLPATLRVAMRAWHEEHEGMIPIQIESFSKLLGIQKTPFLAPRF
jgi:hypothetical protein